MVVPKGLDKPAPTLLVDALGVGPVSDNLKPMADDKVMTIRRLATRKLEEVPMKDMEELGLVPDVSDLGALMSRIFGGSSHHGSCAHHGGGCPRP